MNPENPQKLSLNFNNDNRGTLFEVLSANLVKDFKTKHAYISESVQYVVRGFHQQHPSSQIKLIWCLDGEVNDHLVNIRTKDKDFGKVTSYNLKKGDGIFIPAHFAHGFECISKKCTLLYLCDLPYEPNEQMVLNPFSQEFNKIWVSKKPIVSERDLSGTSLQKIKQTVS